MSFSISVPVTVITYVPGSGGAGWISVRPTATDSASSRLKVFEVSEEYQSNSTPSLNLTGELATIVALVSNNAVFVRTRFHEVELSSASPKVMNGSSEVTLTPGALIIIVCVRRLFASFDSSTKSFGSRWKDKSTRPSVDGVQFH